MIENLNLLKEGQEDLRILFDQLKPEYAHKELVAEAKTQGISPRTAFRWNDKWLHDGLITKSEYGVYRKVG